MEDQFDDEAVKEMMEHVDTCIREWNEEHENEANDTDDVEGESIDAPERPQLYCFQHQALPEALFSNHPELIQEFYGDSTELPLLHFWSRAELLCLQSGFSIDAEDEMLDDDFPFESIALHKFEKGEHTFFVYTMPEPKHETEAYLIGMLHRKTDSSELMPEAQSSRYFTLEKSHNALTAMLCEWTIDRSHLNHGSVNIMQANDFAKFVLSNIEV